LGAAAGSAFSTIGNGGSFSQALTNGAVNGLTSYASNGLASDLGFTADPIQSSALNDFFSSNGNTTQVGRALGLSGPSASGGGLSSNFGSVTNGGLGVGAGGGASAYSPSTSSTFGDIGKSFDDYTNGLSNSSSAPSPAPAATGSASTGWLGNVGDQVSNGVSDAYHSLGFGSGSSGSSSGNLIGNPFNSNTSNNFKLGDLLGNAYSYYNQGNIADAQKQQLGQAQNFLQPYLNAGTAANTQLSNLLGLNGAGNSQSATQALLNDPGYQFRLQQGQQGIDRSLAAQGLGQSGAAIKAANDYAQGSAQQEYQNAIQNLMAQSGAGQNAAGAMGGLSNQLGQVDAARLGQQGNVVNQELGSLFGTNQNQLSKLLTQGLMRTPFG